MIINKSSWHYRLLSAMDCRIPRSLCPYFWKTVFVSFGVTFIGMIAACAVVVFTYGLGFMHSYPYLNERSVFQIFMSMSLYEHFMCVVKTLIADVVLVAFFGTLLYTIIPQLRRDIHEFIYERLPREKRNYEYYSQYLYENAKPKSNSGLIRSFIKARKDKICPVLEFKD